MNCPYCGAPIDPNAKFCNACGAPIAQETPQGQTSSYNNTPFFTPEINNSGSEKPVYIQSRNIATCIILFIVTCGIYGIYWLICLVNDVNEVSENNGSSGGIVFLLSLVTCNIYLLYWMYKTGGDINAAQNMRGIRGDSSSGLIYLILTLVGLGIISYALIQNELNKLVEEFGQE